MSTSQAHTRAADKWANDALRRDEQRRADGQVVLVQPSTTSFFRTWFASRLLLFALVSTVLYYASLALNENPLDYASRTRRLLSKFPLIDGHNDLVYLIRVELKNTIHDAERFTLGEGLLSHTDIPKLRKGQVGGQFWSLYIPCTGKGDFNTPDDTVRDTLEQIDTAHRLFRQFPDVFHYCDNSACARKAFKQGKIASMLGAEGMHQVGNSLGVIRKFHELGMRYITLTHNCDNVFATAWNTVAAGKPDHGLTPFGREAVQEMNRLGMLIDLSHVSHNTMRHVLELSQSPVIFSHTLAYTLAPLFRNVPDDVLRDTARKGGVVMITFVERFLTQDGRKTTVEDVADHVLHVVQVTGSWDFVGIGGDFDGTPHLPKDLEDVSKYPNLFEALMRRGASDADLAKLAGLNILRVWEENERIAKRLQRQRRENEATWSDRLWKQNYYGLPFIRTSVVNP
ncbi:dipeptidyl aminopeptidase [Pterulicium gracile]|uniref:Dipeptidase n=1 Tax=Pterulicium gracile TaxID=1884261 RepID=A0A5C3QGA7_9AGAR|nr:dipeptidyl aminopeptidase [Pterula gracilis]